MEDWCQIGWPQDNLLAVPVAAQSDALIAGMNGPAELEPFPRDGIYHQSGTMFASIKDVALPPCSSGWWPTFPISDYLTTRLERAQNTKSPTEDTVIPQLGSATESLSPGRKAQSSEAGMSSLDITRSRTEGKPTRRRVACNWGLCDQTFLSKRDLRRHIIARHKGGVLRCPRCQKTLGAREDNMKRHQKSYCKAMLETQC